MNSSTVVVSSNDPHNYHCGMHGTPHTSENTWFHAGSLAEGGGYYVYTAKSYYQD